MSEFLMLLRNLLPAGVAAEKRNKICPIFVMKE